MKKVLFKRVLVISFLLITFFSSYRKIDAANFTYKDFKWEEFSKMYNTYWVSFCETSNDENCEDAILKTKRGFYERLYSLLAAAEEKGNFIDDNLIIATVFYGLTPETFRDPIEGVYNPYNIDQTDSKDKYINGEGLDDGAKSYFEQEKDTLKTLVNSFIGYRSHCYVDSNETPQNETCSNANTDYIKGKCMERINTFKGNFWDSLGIKVFGSDAQSKCDEDASKKGFSSGYLKTSSTQEVSDEFFWDYLENSNYLDKKDHLKDYYLPVLLRADKDSMNELIADEDLYNEYKEEIINVRQRIIRNIKDVLDYDETVSNSFKQTKTSLKYWWPIGSDEVNEIDGGILMATGEPASVNITSGYGLRTDPISGEAKSMHSGIDISGTKGQTNIIASKDGVIFAVNDGCEDGGDKSCGNQYGNYIIVQHIDNTYTLYAHLYNGSINVSVNDSVKQGQVIAKLGNSGYSTGPHLHFEVRVGGSDYSSSQNPINFVSTDNTRPSATESQILEWIGNMEGTGPVEGDNYKVYADSGGVLTVGHGITLKYNADQFSAHGIDVSTLSVGSLVSKNTVDAIYQEDLDGRMNNIKSLLSSKGITLNDNQIAALVSLQFNCGNINGFFENYESYGSTESLCTNWWHQKALHDASGNRLSGLEKRRKAECDLFVNGNYNMNVYG